MAVFRRDPTFGAHLTAAIHRLLDDEIAPAIVADAKRLVPVDTGALRDQIDADDAADRKVRIHSRRVVGGDPPQVPVWIEKGTSRMRPRPYLLPAAMRHRSP